MGQALEIKFVEVNLEGSEIYWYTYGTTMEDAVDQDELTHCRTGFLSNLLHTLPHDATELWVPLTVRVTWSDGVVQVLTEHILTFEPSFELPRPPY